MYSYYFGHTMTIPCFGGINHFSEQILVIQQFAMGNHHFYPLVNIQKAIENGHRNSESSH
jgi:hypothetical protein